MPRRPGVYFFRGHFVTKFGCGDGAPIKLCPARGKSDREARQAAETELRRLVVERDQNRASPKPVNAPVRRAKTALSRRAYSTPVKHARGDGLINGATTVLDYGCGRGDDVARLRGEGITCTGWDPVHNPAQPPAEADVVNLGYVLNVIEDPAERA